MLTAHAIKVHESGGPDVLVNEEIDVPEPGSGQVLVRNEAIGLNFLDTYLRSGRYAAETPFVPGHEGAGVVERVGAGVTDIASAIAWGTSIPLAPMRIWSSARQTVSSRFRLVSVRAWRREC